VNLNEALTYVAERMNLDAAELIAYAAEDTLTGSMDGEFSPISVTSNEGRILYALVRALKPTFSLEVGTHSGCSASHILTALAANEGDGHLHSIDFYPVQPPGIAEALQARWSFEQMDARNYEFPAQVDFVFEDSDHSRDMTEKILRRAIEHGARCVVSHDAYNTNVYSSICGGFEDVVGKDYLLAMVDDIPLGFAIWFRGA
jgi:predicted O-methyltransferase YrrM